MSISQQLVWTLLPALGLTYGIMASDLLNLPRGLFLIAAPKIGRTFIGCAMCVGTWCAMGTSALNEFFNLYQVPIGRALLSGLSMAGIFWQLTAFAGAIAGRNHGTEKEKDIESVCEHDSVGAANIVGQPDGGRCPE